jgi:hypothetical protein
MLFKIHHLFIIHTKLNFEVHKSKISCKYPLKTNFHNVGEMLFEIVFKQNKTWCALGL